MYTICSWKGHKYTSFCNLVHCDQVGSLRCPKIQDVVAIVGTIVAGNALSNSSGGVQIVGPDHALPFWERAATPALTLVAPHPIVFRNYVGGVNVVID